MPVADLLIIGIIVVSCLISAIRGAVSEITALSAWFAAFFAAKYLAVPVADMAFHSIQPHALAVAVAFVVVFFTASLLLRWLSSGLTTLIAALGLGSINRILGGVIGTLKGVLMVTLVVMVCSHTDLVYDELWQSSALLHYFESLAQMLMSSLWNDYTYAQNSIGITV